MTDRNKVSEGIYHDEKLAKFQKINQLKHKGLHNIYLYPDLINRSYFTHNSVYLPDNNSIDF